MYCSQSCKHLAKKIINPQSKRKSQVRYACEVSRGTFIRLSVDENGVPVMREDCPKHAE